MEITRVVRLIIHILVVMTLFYVRGKVKKTCIPLAKKQKLIRVLIVIIGINPLAPHIFHKVPENPLRNLYIT